MLKILFIDAVDADATNKPFETENETLSLTYLAAYLREHVDPIEIRIIDRHIEEEIRKFHADIVGISFVTVNFFIATRYAEIARSHGAKIVAGGPHVSSAPQTLPISMDVGVVGEGEDTLLELVKVFPIHHWEDPEELKGIRGIVFHSGQNGISMTPHRPFLELDKLPMPARDLFPHPRRGIMSSRGCPYKCSFCFRCHLERKVRYLSAENVVKEILHIVDTYHVSHIHIFDDLFIIPRKRFENVVEALKGEGIPGRISFNCNVRPNLVDERLARQLLRLNVTSVFLGIESGVQRVLSSLKPQSATVEQNERAIRILNDHGILTTAGIIIGSHDETREEMFETLDWIKRSELDQFELMLLTPLPGTEVWNEALQRGIVSYDMDWSRLDLRADEMGKEPVVVSRAISKEEMIYIYDLFLRERDAYRKKNSKKILSKTMMGLVRHPRILMKKLVSPDSYRMLARLLK